MSVSKTTVKISWDKDSQGKYVGNAHIKTNDGIDVAVNGEGKNMQALADALMNEFYNAIDTAEPEEITQEEAIDNLYNDVKILKEENAMLRDEISMLRKKYTNQIETIEKHAEWEKAVDDFLKRCGRF